MVKKFYIVSCAALVACLCLFSQDAGATARQSEATALAPAASAGAPIRLAQGPDLKAKKAPRRAKKLKKNVKKRKKLKATGGTKQDPGLDGYTGCLNPPPCHP